MELTESATSSSPLEPDLFEAPFQLELLEFWRRFLDWYWKGAEWVRYVF